MSTIAVPAPKRKKHRIYESKGEPYFQAFLVIFFALLSVTFLYPYWHVLVNSFTTPDFASAAGFSQETMAFVSLSRVKMVSGTKSSTAGVSFGFIPLKRSTITLPVITFLITFHDGMRN